jgi:hypothetical protein
MGQSPGPGCLGNGEGSAAAGEAVSKAGMAALKAFSRGPGGLGQARQNHLARFSYLDLTMLEDFEPIAVAASFCPTELTPIQAIASIPMKRIAPSTAFAFSHLWNVS